MSSGPTPAHLCAPISPLPRQITCLTCGRTNVPLSAVGQTIPSVDKPRRGHLIFLGANREC